jgi:ketosteroid isomerase-like protein
MNRRKLLVVVPFAFVLHCQLVMAQEKRAARPRVTTVEQALSDFITAFDNLDWLAFRECFSAKATMFHPSAPNIRRIDAPKQFEKAWLGVFDRIKRSSGRNAPPYMDLRPLDLLVEPLSNDVTLVTFHLVDGTVLNRRTLVFRRESTGWRIVHIHASNLIMP